jgi:hypothetical protein
MKPNLTPREIARLIVEHHTQGAICSGEVYGLFLEHFTSATFPDFMAELTPDLQANFRNRVQENYPVNCSSDIERQALLWLSDYYKIPVTDRKL